jgi:enoyl-[acyl-carrier protein] reductase II
MLALKKLTPVRLIKNKFFNDAFTAEQNGADAETLQHILGRARAKKGMFEGDMNEGELEIGQIASLVKEIKPAAEIVKEIWNEFELAKNEILKF